MFKTSQQQFGRERDGGQRRIELAQDHLQLETQQRDGTEWINVRRYRRHYACGGCDVAAVHHAGRALPLGFEIARKDSERARLRRIGLMMGGRFLSTSYSDVLAAALGKLSSIEIAEGETLNIADALVKYDQLFVFSAEIGIASGLVLLVLTPLIRRWMHGVK